MKIGIVGTGNMGRSLGVLRAQQGYEVSFGARDLDRANEAVMQLVLLGLIAAACAMLGYWKPLPTYFVI